MRGRKPVGLPLTLLLGSAAVGLGFWGFSQLRPDFGATDSFYRSLQLLALQDDGVVDPPWQLEVARHLAALALGLAVITLVLAFAHERADRIRTRLGARGHHVVMGLGERGRAVASRLADEGRRVVAIDHDPDGDGASFASSRGIPVIVGDARDPETLRAAAVARAEHVLICLGDDSTNLEALESCIDGASAEGPPLHVAIDGHLLWRELHRSALGMHAPGPAIEFVALPDRAAARLVEEAGDALRAGRAVVWGRGPTAVRTAVHATRRSLLAGADPRLVLAGPCADELREELAESEPWVVECGGADVTLDPVADGSERGVAFVAGLPRADALAGASVLAKGLESWPVVMDGSSRALARALERSGFPTDRVRIVDAQAQVLGPALFEGSARELMARARHDYYVEQDLARGSTPRENPSLRPWDELPDSLRQSNRRFADSVGERLGDLGFELEPLTAPVRPPPMDRDLVEELARVEHGRWMSDLLADGWRHHDAAKDAQRKLHPLLVPWDELDEREREKDRDSIRALPRLLAQVGYELRAEGR